MVLFCLCCAPVTWGKKRPPKIITAQDGAPIRKVYIQTAIPNAALSVAAQLELDTCLTPVPIAKEADAVLDLSMVLPTTGGGLPTPNIFGMSAKAQTLGNAKSNVELNSTVSCSDDKGNKGCVGSNNAPAGDLTALPAAGMPTGPTADYEISLVSQQNNAQELWSPETHSKRPWTDQLRVVAGCPVCPGEHFDRRKYKNYRAWIGSCSPPPSR